jgi:hypothetical protein
MGMELVKVSAVNPVDWLRMLLPKMYWFCSMCFSYNSSCLVSTHNKGRFELTIKKGSING